MKTLVSTGAHPTPASETHILWMSKDASEGIPALREKTLLGSIADAITHVTDVLAIELDFLMGQVLESDGRVVANIAPGGAVRRSD
jgi:hypothetical protein